MNERRRIILGLVFITIALMFCSPVSAESAAFRDEVPQGVSGAEFPDVVSYFDSRGVLWVFWMEDSKVYYSYLTDMAQWDITTSYKDHMRGSELTIWRPEAGPVNHSIIVVIVIILTASSFALRRPRVSHRI